MFFRLLHYFTVSLTGSAFEERSSSSADVDGYDQSGCRFIILKTQLLTKNLP